MTTPSSTERVVASRVFWPERLRRAGVPPRHLDADVSNWVPRPGTQDAVKAAGEWSSAIGTEGGLVLIGPPGTGKTHLVVAALRNRMIAVDAVYPDGPERARLLHAHFEVVPLLLDRLRAAVRYTESRVEEEFAHYRDDCPLLVLDDLGREKVTDWVADRLYVLIESRYGRRLPTVVTTNLTLDELAANGYGALVSRLTETCRFARTTAKDYRPEKGRGAATPRPEDDPTKARKEVHHP